MRSEADGGRGLPKASRSSRRTPALSSPARAVACSSAPAAAAATATIAAAAGVSPATPPAPPPAPAPAAALRSLGATSRLSRVDHAGRDVEQPRQPGDRGATDSDGQLV